MNNYPQKTQLRFMTCGSVDDGKSTLIGRLLYDCGEVFEDQFQGLKNDSKKYGTRGEDIDFALLLDGLSAEREQGITIDVAYRYFSTKKRSFIVADTPGHEEYTRNMVTAAASCQATIILIDARNGITIQTKRHAYIANMMGINKIILAINKMDLVEYSQDRFKNIVDEFEVFAKSINIDSFEAIPISAVFGDNILSKSMNMPWYMGETIVHKLENISIENKANDNEGFILPVQYVNRPNYDFRGYCGTIARGKIRKGDEICILPSGRTTKVSRIISSDCDVDFAHKNEAITLCFENELDCSRGDTIVENSKRLEISDQFKAQIIWFSQMPLIPRRKIILKIGTQNVNASIEPPEHKIDFSTLGETATNTLKMNDVGDVKLSTDEPIVYSNFKECAALGQFIIIDKFTNETLGAGMIKYALRRAKNIHWQALTIGREEHAAQKSQKPAILWLTGISGSGKSTISNILEKRLFEMGYHTFLLDGDNVRHGLCRDLGFTQQDRIENIRRVAHVARLMSDAGLIVITAFISPFSAERELARSLAMNNEFIEIFVDTSLEIAEMRDPKGLYKKARNGEISNFTGIDSPYEKPNSPEIILKTDIISADECAEYIIKYLITNGFIK